MGTVDNLPTGKHQVDYVKSLRAKTKKIKISYAKSKHPAKSLLAQATSKIESAAGKKNSEDVKTALEDAEKKLTEAAKKLGI